MKVWAGWFSEPLSLARGRPSPHVVVSAHVCVLISYYRDPSQIGSGPT